LQDQREEHQRGVRGTSAYFLPLWRSGAGAPFGLEDFRLPESYISENHNGLTMFGK
jgi:hypothetical protein